MRSSANSQWRTLQRRTLRALPFAVIIAVAAALIPLDASRPRAETPAIESRPVAQPGRIVYKDPVTGELRAPTAEEYLAMFGSAGATPGVKSDAMPPVEMRPDGSRRLRVGGNFTAAIHATIGDDGVPQVECGDTAPAHESETLR